MKYSFERYEFFLRKLKCRVITWWTLKVNFECFATVIFHNFAFACNLRIGDTFAKSRSNIRSCSWTHQAFTFVCMLWARNVFTNSSWNIKIFFFTKSTYLYVRSSNMKNLHAHTYNNKIAIPKWNRNIYYDLMKNY